MKMKHDWIFKLGMCGLFFGLTVLILVGVFYDKECSIELALPIMAISLLVVVGFIAYTELFAE